MSRKSGRAQAAAIKTRVSAANGAPLASLVSGPSLTTARIEEIDGDRVRVSISGQSVLTLRDEAVHPAVLRGAQRRGERVFVERRDDGAWVVIGALRTQPTPGIDVGEEFTIEAEKITVKGHSEVTLAAETASVAVRAEGEIESQAPRILSRAEGLHKITGRTLKLN